MKPLDWIVWVLASVLIVDLIVVEMAATGRLDAQKKEDPTLIYQRDVAKILNAMDVAGTKGALNLPIGELNNFILVNRQVRKVRENLNASIAKNPKTVLEIATDILPSVEKLNTLFKNVETKAPEWKPYRKEINRLLELVRVK